MAQITGQDGDGSRNLYWENSVPCSTGEGGCKSPWLFILALAAAAWIGKKKKGRR